MAISQKENVNSESNNFGNVTKFSDFSDLVFGLSDPDGVQARVVNRYLGSEFKSVTFDKLSVLTTSLGTNDVITQMWIYDDQGNSYDIDEIRKRLAPEGLTEGEREEMIKMSWLKDSQKRSHILAHKLGGVSQPLENWSWDLGVHSLIVLSQSDKESNIVFRGVSDQENDLDGQVCPMLRTGIDTEGRDAYGPVGMDLRSEIITQPEIVAAVENLADAPTEAAFVAVIDLYKKYELSLLVEQSAFALDMIKKEMGGRSAGDFAKALKMVHHDCLRGNVGHSPYLATSRGLRKASVFANGRGMTMVLNLSDKQSSDSEYDHEAEVFVSTRVDRKDVLAVLPFSNISSSRVSKNNNLDIWEKCETEVLGLVKPKKEPDFTLTPLRAN